MAARAPISSLRRAGALRKRAHRNTRVCADSSAGDDDNLAGFEQAIGDILQSFLGLGPDVSSGHRIGGGRQGEALEGEPTASRRRESGPGLVRGREKWTAESTIL